MGSSEGLLNGACKKQTLTVSYPTLNCVYSKCNLYGGLIFIYEPQIMSTPCTILFMLVYGTLNTF